MTIINVNSISGINSITAQGASGIEFFDSSGSSVQKVTGDGLTVGTGATISGSTNTITASTNGEERLRINSNGQIGIGSNFSAIEDKPGITIDVGGVLGNPGLFLKATGYTGNQTKLWSDNNNAVSRLQATERSLILEAGNTSSHYIQFDVAGSEQASITTDGLKLASGNGINFSAYATSGNPSSNLLDDYEEGTWNVTLNANLTAQTAYSKGYYVKVGSMVWVNYSFKVNTVSGGDAVTFGSLPFPNEANAGNTSKDTFLHAAWQNVSVGDRGLNGYMSGSSTTVEIFKTRDNNTPTALLNSDLAVNDFVWISGWYRTSA